MPPRVGGLSLPPFQSLPRGRSRRREGRRKGRRGRDGGRGGGMGREGGGGDSVLL